MAWHYLNDDLEPCIFSPEREGESLLTLSQGTYPSALSKLIPSQEEFFYNDSGTAYYQGSLFGTMFAPSTEKNGAGLSILSREGFLVRTLALQERARELKEIEAGSGMKWCASFAKLAPDMSSWKIPQSSLFGESMSFSETWPKWGIMLNGECWERLTAGASFSVFESGLSQAETPEVYQHWERHLKSGRLIPAPLASDRKGASSVRFYNSEEYRSNLREFLRIGTADGQYPNPRLSEWLMGWPDGWTDLQPLAMDRFQSWLLQHREF